MKEQCIAWKTFLERQMTNGRDPETDDINLALIKELDNCFNAKNSEEELYERFYKDVEFGTGGLRGILGAGTNRMNVYTVAKATQGIAAYIAAGEYLKDSPLKDKTAKEVPAVAIAYDSRINSKLFAKISAEVLNANHIDVYLYEELMPTPALSFAVRRFECAMGIMITASHNPAEYNGYKVYDNWGCQVTLEAAEKIFSYIDKTNIFEGVKRTGGNGKLVMLGEDTCEAYLDAVLSESTQNMKNGVERKELQNLCVVYTPLNGAGNKCVRKMLEKISVKKVHVVSEQELPDGNFPTCPYPNPEKAEALRLGLETCYSFAEAAKANGKKDDVPDLLLATDPDCDRIGIAAYTAVEDCYKLLSGNEVGVLLLDFMIKTKAAEDRCKNPCLITTIVSTKMAEAVAKKCGIKLILTLTGFKFIGEQIGFMETENREGEYLFGFEESYGYLSGTYVRDKDAVNGAMLICEMAAYYKARGKSLPERLEELYCEYGYYKNVLADFSFQGAKGMEKMRELMAYFRTSMPPVFAGRKVTEINDYEKQIKGLPKADVTEAVLEDGSSFIVRPSGTEPKLKIYISAKGDTAKAADDIVEKLRAELAEIVQSK